MAALPGLTPASPTPPPPPRVPPPGVQPKLLGLSQQQLGALRHKALVARPRRHAAHQLVVQLAVRHLQEALEHDAGGDEVLCVLGGGEVRVCVLG